MKIAERQIVIFKTVKNFSYSIAVRKAYMPVGELFETVKVYLVNYCQKAEANFKCFQKLSELKILFFVSYGHWEARRLKL